jgi:DNA mismatch repair protein MSH4
LQNVICAVSEARGVTPTVGVAFINISIGEVTLSQICDNQSYVKTIHKIQMMSPNKIVCMATTCPPNRPSTLYSLIKEHVSESQIDAFDRSSWSEIDGLDYIQDLALEGDVEPLKVAINGKYYAVTALAAVRISTLVTSTDTY